MADNKNQVVCPDCEAVIVLPKNAEVGDILECQECGTEVELLSLTPLKYAELVEEK